MQVIASNKASLHCTDCNQTMHIVQYCQSHEKGTSIITLGWLLFVYFMF